MIDQARSTDVLDPTDRAREVVLEYMAVARERLAVGSESLKAYVVKEPARALGIAMGVGILLGWVIKRR